MDSRDHRRIGQDLDLFHMEDHAPGMVFWHPRGWLVYRAIEDAVRRLMLRQELREVRSPQLMRQAVWEASGHWSAFPEGMFKIEDDERPAALKPVSCPAHLLIARNAALSYRDLPYRLGELGLVHRDEQSGALHGLFRLRQFVQDDGHILCAVEDVAVEVKRFCDSLGDFYAAFGFPAPSVAFSSRPALRLGDDAVWDRAEALLRAAADAAGLRVGDHEGQGAFYGPKLEFMLEDQLGRAWQCGTIQLDLVLAERFDVAYVGPDGQRRRPAILHRAVLGSLERFLGVLLEQCAGRLPPFLAPEQVVVAPISEAQRGAAGELLARLAAAGIRAELDAAESLSHRIAAAHRRAVPFMAILGEREVQAGSVALRAANAQRVLPVEAAIREVAAACSPPI